MFKLWFCCEFSQYIKKREIKKKRFFPMKDMKRKEEVLNINEKLSTKKIQKKIKCKTKIKS